MAENVQVAAFEGGQLSVGATGERTNEAVLALPLSRLLVKMVRIPADHREEAAAFAGKELAAMSPYPDEALTVGLETVREGSDGVVALAAALPESSADDIGEALDAAKLNITRIDALALGVLRARWDEIAGAGAGAAGEGARRLVLIKEKDDIALFVLDGEVPVAVRAVSADADLRREAMLSLIEAEDFGGERTLAEVVVIGDVAERSSAISTNDADATARSVSEPYQNDTDAAAGLGAFAPVRTRTATEAAGAGIAERSLESGTLNALPESWRQMLEETRFKAKLKKGLTAAIGLWAVVMAVLFGVPMVYGYMTDHQKSLSREHARRYNEVKEMREKVRLVQKYSDHSRGALEILKAVSDRLPTGVELNNWTFKREEGVRFSGESADAASVYRFKDALLAMALGEGDDAEKVFAEVVLTGPSAVKGGRQKFDIDCRYESEEER